MRRLLLLAAVPLMAVACGNPHLLVTGHPTPPNVQPGQHDGGPPHDGGIGCATDCDCGPGTYCGLSINSGPRQCIIGINTCSHQCQPQCDAGFQCNTGTGACEPLHCPIQINCPTGFFCDPTGNCEPNPEISVDGGWKTAYVMDVSAFAQANSDILTILDLLNALVTNNCPGLSTTLGQILCDVVTILGININAPPWVSDLLTVLEGLFKFGNSPVTATGLMTLQEGPHHVLTATEQWSTLYVEYNGQMLDLMNSPLLGQNGNVTVTINPFGGTRDATNVYLGSRDVSFDVNKFIIALLDVAINAISNGQATDLPSLVELVLCSQIPNLATQLACNAAAQSFLGNLTSSSGLGGFTFSHQNAVIYAPPGSWVANGLGKPTALGVLQGDMSNGIVSGNLGPTSGWYGTR